MGNPWFSLDMLKFLLELFGTIWNYIVVLEIKDSENALMRKYCNREIIP
jgi:hypothetical protein